MSNTVCAAVLTGGGSRGAFSVGALKYLIINKHKRYDIFSGVSVGALNASFLAQYTDQVQGIKDLEALWLNLETRDVYRRWFMGRFAGLLWKRGLYNIQPLRDLIRRSVDAEKIKSSGKTLLIGSVCLDTSLYRQVDQYSDNLIDHIIASSAIPLLFQPCSVDNGNTYDVDGGIRNNAPISGAIKCGANNITIICADSLSLKHVDSCDMSTLDIAKRSIDIMADEVINNDINLFLATNNKVTLCKQYIPEQYHDLIIGNKKYIPNIIIKPNNILVEDSTVFNPEEIRKMIDEGYETAKAVYEKQNK